MNGVAQGGSADITGRVAARTLLEREQELGHVDTLLDDAKRGSGAALVISGRAGIGKSTLLHVTSATAYAHTFTVLSARGSEFEGDLAFGVVHQLFGPVLAGLAEGMRARLLEGAARLASGALGLDDDRLTQPALFLRPEGAFATDHGLYWLVSNLSEQGPLLIELDDAQWADPPSLRALGFLTARIEDLPVALVLAARSELPPRQERLLTALAEAPRATLCEPQALSETAVARMVRERVGEHADEEFCRACYRATSGNPFLTRELLGSLVREQIAPTAALAGRVLGMRSPTIARSVQGRLRRLSTEATRLAEALTVLGPGTRAADAALLAGLEPAAARSAAMALTRADILAAADALEFAHPLVEAAVRDAIEPERRARLHAEAARMLGDAPGSLGRVGAHLLRTEPAGDPAVVAALREAAAQARTRGAPDTAAALLERAILEPPPASEEAALHGELGRARLAAGDARGLEDLETARKLSTDARARAELDLALGMARYERGDVAGSMIAFARGIGELDDPRDELRLSLLAGEQIAVRVQPGERSGERLEAVLDGDERGRTPIERLLLAQIAFERTQTGIGPHDEVAELGARAVPDASVGPLDPFDSLALPLASMSLYFSDHHARAERALDAAVEAAQHHGLILAYGTASFFRGACRFLNGRLRDAIDDWHGAFTAADHGWAFALPSAHALMALCSIEREETALAERMLALPGGDERWRAHATFPYVIGIRGRLRYELGEPREGLEGLLAAGEAQHALHSPNPALLPWRSAAALIAAELGEPELAEQLAEEELELALAFGAASAVGIARRARGVLHSDREELAEAVRVLASSGAHFEHARALYALGELLLAEGGQEEGHALLAQAFALARRCGGLALARRAATLLAELDGTAPQPVLVGADLLNPAERRVTALALAGGDHRQIAQQLFLSATDVSELLDGALARLGVLEPQDLDEALRAPVTHG